MGAWATRWWGALLDAWALLLPVDCAGCGANDRGLCGDCLHELAPDLTPRITAGGLSVVTALRYEGRVRRIILALKEHQRTDVATALSRPLEAAIRRSLAAGLAELVTVPTGRTSYRRRGYDPVALLLRPTGFARSRVLMPARRTSAQKSLGSAARALNLSGALIARASLAGRRFVLVDDILTTGATLDEAARAIRAAGGEVLGAATLAFTPRLFPGRDKPTAEDYGGAKGAAKNRLGLHSGSGGRA